MITTLTTAERLAAILSETNNTLSSLATEIGLSQKQSLYDIKKGRIKQISFAIAMRIHQRYPQYSIDWLMGKSDINIVQDPSDILPGISDDKIRSLYIQKMEELIEQLKERLADKDKIIEAKDDAMLYLRKLVEPDKLDENNNNLISTK